MLSSMVRGAIVCTVAMVSCAVSAAQPTMTRVQGVGLEHKTVDHIQIGERVRIEKFRVPNRLVDLEMTRVEVLTHDAQLVLGTKDGMKDLPRPDVVILSGSVAGELNTTAYLAISPYGNNGFIDLQGQIISISTGEFAQGKDLHDALRSANLADVIDPNNAPEICGYTNGDTALEPSGPMNEFVEPNTRGGAECRIAGIAIDTDYEYTFRLFSNNTNASAAYAISLIGAISEIYQRDLNVRLAIPFLRVWGDNSDPYSPTAGDPLDQLRDEWNATMGSVDRTVAHLLTGRQDTSYGGVAYVSQLCSSNFGYGVSAHLRGSFPYPLDDHNGGNWDLVVVAHELGHNFGTSHTHNYSPAIDGCGSGDCAGAFGGTIMSYCHTCSGGMNNLVLEFHPRVQDVVIGYMNSINCNFDGQAVSAVADSAETIVNTGVELDVLANDVTASCNEISISSTDSNSVEGGSISVLPGQGAGGRDLLEYTPLSGFVGSDSFSYTVSGDGGSESASVNIEVLPLRAPVTRVSPIDGLAVEFYELGSLSVLPDFDALTPYASDVVTSVNYPSTGGEFMGSGRADNVGAVLTGYVRALFDGVYTFSTESDDGSRLLIGDQLVVNNDGLHGMARVGGTIALASGWHQIRIEVFERGGDAGLISTVSGPLIPTGVLAGAMLSHEAPTSACSPADFTADGALDIFDVFAFLELFNAEDPSADFTGDTIIDIFDVFAFLEVYNAGCPG